MRTKKEMIDEIVYSKYKKEELKEGKGYLNYYKAVLLKLLELDEQHKISIDEIPFDDGLIGWVFLDSDLDTNKDLEYYIMNVEYDYLKMYHRDYVIEKWDLGKDVSKQQKIEYRLRLFKESLVAYKELLIRAAIEDYDRLRIEENLYYFLLLEEYGIKPTEELYEIFCNSQEAFKREITISKLLAA